MYHVTLMLLPHELTEDKRAYLFYHIFLRPFDQIQNKLYIAPNIYITPSLISLGNFIFATPLRMIIGIFAYNPDYEQILSIHLIDYLNKLFYKSYQVALSCQGNI
jgi:hypothetical protein